MSVVLLWFVSSVLCCSWLLVVQLSFVGSSVGCYVCIPRPQTIMTGLWNLGGENAQKCAQTDTLCHSSCSELSEQRLVVAFVPDA